MADEEDEEEEAAAFHGKHREIRRDARHGLCVCEAQVMDAMGLRLKRPESAKRRPPNRLGALAGLPLLRGGLADLLVANLGLLLLAHLVCCGKKKDVRGKV